MHRMSTMQTFADERRSDGVARRIRGLMAELQIRQKTVAEVLGYSQQALSRRTTGAVAFSVDEIETLARLFGVTEAYLYGFTNERAPGQTTGGSLYAIRDSNPEPADSSDAVVLEAPEPAWGVVLPFVPTMTTTRRLGEGGGRVVPGGTGAALAQVYVLPVVERSA